MERFDVIVVGAGSAGCVFATRVAAARAHTLLLEAGPDRRERPAAELLDGWGLPGGGEQDEPGYEDWGYHAEPDATGSALRARRGRLVGGTSHLTRFGVRGSPADYDEWERLGNPGWGWDDVLPTFRALEADAEFGTEPWHGSDGPIPITRYPDIELPAVHRAVREALVAGGFAPVADHNRPGAVGVGPMPMSSRDGVRVTTASAYLGTGARDNLRIRADAQVASVILEGLRAIGVRLLDGSDVLGDRVVLCAGVYGSPPILLRSGIGPAADLGALGIATAVDLPGVGTNLADHPSVDLELRHEGQARDTPLLHTIGSFHSGLAADGDAPDLLAWVQDPTTVADPAFGVDILLMKPRSRGRVSLRSADPAAAPRIELPGLREEADVERLAEGYRRMREILGLAPDSEEEVLRHVREDVYSIPHVVGTCAMGPEPGEGAVVDAASRVHGTQGLFVADASVIPIPLSGFPQLPTIMLAERIAEMLSH